MEKIKMEFIVACLCISLTQSTEIMYEFFEMPNEEFQVYTTSEKRTRGRENIENSPDFIRGNLNEQRRLATSLLQRILEQTNNNYEKDVKCARVKKVGPCNPNGCVQGEIKNISSW